MLKIEWENIGNKINVYDKISKIYPECSKTQRLPTYHHIYAYIIALLRQHWEMSDTFFGNY